MDALVDSTGPDMADMGYPSDVATDMGAAYAFVSYGLGAAYAFADSTAEIAGQAAHGVVFAVAVVAAPATAMEKYMK
ncbi:hypothetical protein BASA81_014802 [Batrachochytrium salamandrivorans]|nr:hypothetical protein BASA81_014802 [Batrachochytrium salamandrivorans]